VANERTFVDQVLQKALRLIESEVRAEVVAAQMEMF